MRVDVLDDLGNKVGTADGRLGLVSRLSVRAECSGNEVRVRIDCDRNPGNWVEVALDLPALLAARQPDPDDVCVMDDDGVPF